MNHNGINMSNTPYQKQTSGSEMFQYFVNTTSFPTSNNGEKDFLNLVWNSLIVSTIEDHFKDDESGTLINPFEDDDHGRVESMLINAQQTARELYESGFTWAYQLLCLMQHENTLADHGNEISTKIIQICLANGLESIIRAFPSIVTKKDTVSQWLSMLRLIINGTPQVADQICKTLNNTSMNCTTN